MAITPGVTPVVEIWPHGGRILDEQALRGVQRASFPPGATFPALGLVLAGASRFTAVSHTYRASMRPVATADAPSPAAVFSDRACTAYVGSGHQQTVVAVEWVATDLAISGRYRLQFKATAVAGGAVEYLPDIEVEVAGDAFIPMSFPQYGLLYWGGWSNAHAAINQELARNNLVVYSEPNAVFDYSGAAAAYLAIRPTGIPALSFNDWVVFVNGTPYYPFHLDIKALADSNDYWVRRQSGATISPAANLWLFDKTHTDFRNWIVDEIVKRFLTTYPFTVLFLDERNAGLQAFNGPQDIVLYREQATRAASMTQDEVTAAWTSASQAFARRMKDQRPQIRIIGNGTLGADPWSEGVMRQGVPGTLGNGAVAVFDEALAVSSSVPIQKRLMLAHGIWFGDSGRPPQFLNATTALTDQQLLDMNTFNGSVVWLSPGFEASFRSFCKYIACYAALIDAHAEVDNNTFTWPWNHQEVAEGSFGPPIEYLNRTSTVPVITSSGFLRIRYFQNATVVVNLGASSTTYLGNPIGVFEALVLPPA